MVAWQVITWYNANITRPSTWIKSFWYELISKGHNVLSIYIGSGLSRKLQMRANTYLCKLILQIVYKSLLSFSFPHHRRHLVL
jgi:hypothetical protein